MPTTTPNCPAAVPRGTDAAVVPVLEDADDARIAAARAGRTSTEPLDQWWEVFQRQSWFLRYVVADLDDEALVGVGIAPVDAGVFAQVWRNGHSPSTVSGWKPQNMLIECLAMFCRVGRYETGRYARGPHLLAMPVRDAVGWSVLATQGAEGSSVASGAEDLLTNWSGETQATLVPQGWLYAAAGLTRAETEAGLADGTLSEAKARWMTGLRGVPVLPANPGVLEA